MSAVPARGLTRTEVRDRVLAGQVNTQPPAPGRTVAQILRAKRALGKLAAPARRG